MSIKITKAVPSDIPTLASVREAAYANDRFKQLDLLASATTEQRREYQQHQLESLNVRFDMPNRNYFKAVDESSGRIVGFSCWNAPERDVKGDEGKEKAMPELPVFVNKKKLDEIGERFKEAKGKTVGERDDYWYLQAMCVLSECQGRGVGDALLKQGLRDLVDRDGLDCYLEASEVAGRLYERNGFKPAIPMPIEVPGGTYVVMAMLRRAPS